MNEDDKEMNPTILNESEFIVGLKYGSYLCTCGWDGYPQVRFISESDPKQWKLICRSCGHSASLVRTS